MEPDLIIEKQKRISNWVKDHGDMLYSWAYYKTSNEAIAKDLIQETFLSAFQSLASFKNGSSPKTWLFSILKNKVIDHYRKAAMSSPSPIDDSDDKAEWFDSYGNWKKEYRPEHWLMPDENILDNPAFNAILSRCLGKLPSVWSACVQLKYLGEKETEDICQQLEITSSNLWQILHRAKLQLRHCLEKNWFKS